MLAWWKKWKLRVQKARKMALRAKKLGRLGQQGFRVYTMVAKAKDGKGKNQAAAARLEKRFRR